MDNTSFFWILNAGYKNGLRYSLTGDHIDAQEALRIGLVNAVYPQDQLIEEVDPSDAETLVANGALCLDARTTSEFEKGMLPGALNVPAAMFRLQSCD